jgi:hypothetical protein
MPILRALTTVNHVSKPVGNPAERFMAFALPAGLTESHPFTIRFHLALTMFPNQGRSPPCPWLFVSGDV